MGALRFSGDGEWDKPSGLAFDSRRQPVHGGQRQQPGVQKLTKDGDFIAKWGSEGSGDGELNMPWGITVDKHDNVYIADWRNDRIQKFDSGGNGSCMAFGSTGDW